MTRPVHVALITRLSIGKESRSLQKKFTVNGAIEPLCSEQFYIVKPELDGLTRVAEAGDFFMLVGPRGSGKTTTGYFLLQLLRRTRGYVPLGLHLKLHCTASCDALSFWAGLSTSLRGSAREMGIEIIHFHDAAGFQDAFRASRWLGHSSFVLMIDEFDALKRLPSDVKKQVCVLRL